MAEHEDQLPGGDDALARRALTSLRSDVEALPLAEPAFVRARGASRRRQRLVAWAAAAAVAVVVGGSAGYAALAHRPSPAPAPPASTGAASPASSTASATTTADSLDEPGALPLLQEWTSTLGLTGHARLTRVTEQDHECLATNPRGQVQRQQVTVDGLAFEGGQTRWSVDATTDPQTVAEGIASDIAGCQAGPGFTVRLAAAGWPRLYSYTAGPAGSGWFAVVPGAHDVTLLLVVDPSHPTSVFTQAQVATLADIAQQRLGRYGSGATPTSSTTTSSPSGPKAINEQMPVSGVAPLLPSSLFVAASQWTSPGFAQGAKASAGPGAHEGSATVVQCETDTQQAGIGGRYGIVTVRAGSGSDNVIGAQRVRLFEDVDAAGLAKQDVRGLDTLIMRGCRQGSSVTTAVRGPHAGTYLLTTRPSGSGSGGIVHQWVGVSLQHTGGAVTTIVFHGTPGGQGFSGTPAQGFEELDRLLALARQK